MRVMWKEPTENDHLTLQFPSALKSILMFFILLFPVHNLAESHRSHLGTAQAVIWSKKVSVHYLLSTKQQADSVSN